MIFKMGVSDNMKRTHEAGRVSWVRADLVVDFDKALLDNGIDFSASQGIL
jgi:hypothetical protein